jgi:hypothetical protein
MSRWLKRLEELASPPPSLSPPVQNVRNAQNTASARATALVPAGSEQIEQFEHGREETENRERDWRERYDGWFAFQRRMGRRRSPALPAAELDCVARDMAWSTVASEWYRLHGERAPSGICAGCRQPLAGTEEQLLPHGERAHAELTCVIAYGRRWKRAATKALAQYGIPAPRGDDENGAFLEAGAA